MTVKTAWIGGSYCAAAGLDPKAIDPSAEWKPERRRYMESVMDAIKMYPGSSVNEVAETVRIPVKAARYAIGSLRARGLVASRVAMIEDESGATREIKQWHPVDIKDES